MTTTNPPAARAGSYRVGDLDLNRIGYGAMQLAGPGVFGPPRDRAAAIEVLRTAVELGTSSVDHLRENIAGAALALPPDAVAELDAI